MTDKFLRISSLFERPDLVHIDGQWCVPMAGLGEVLAQGGLEIVPRGHGAQREAATARDVAHETAPGDFSKFCIWHGRYWCECDLASSAREKPAYDFGPEPEPWSSP
jgi:hypothetical protein